MAAANNKLTKKSMGRAKDILQAVRDSAIEGFDGSWNAFTEDGKDGFDHMATLLEELAEILNIKLDDYKSQDDDDEDEE